MNLGNFIFHQGNGVSNNGDPRNPGTPERLYMQREYPMIVQRQGYHNNNRPESFDSVFSPEVPVTQISNPMPARICMNQLPSDGRLMPEQPVLQRLNSVVAEMQRHRQSVNCLAPCNDRGVLQEQPAMQSFISTPGIMQGNQVGNGRQRALELFELFSGNQIMQTPDPIPTQMQGNITHGTDWVESIEFYSGILKDASTSNYNQNVEVAGPLGNYQSSIQSSAEIHINGCFPQSANCYVDTYGRDVSFRDLQPQVDFMGINNAPPTPANGASNRGVSSAMMFSENISYSQIASAWTQPEFSTSVMQQQERPLVINQTVGTYSLENIPSDAYPLPYQFFNNPPSTSQVKYAASPPTQSMDNLASPPRVEYPAASSTTTLINIPPVTPEKQSFFSINQLFATDKSSVIESCSPGKDEQEILPKCAQGVGNYSSHLLPDVVSSPANSISLKEKVPEDRASGGIHSNRTPQQKPQKRKKHRPKVVVEGKPKRSPKVDASKAENSSSNPKAKRKYVRRKGLNTPTTLENEKNELEASTSVSASRSCRRELNFSSEQKEEKFLDISESVQLEQYPHRSKLNLNFQETTASMGSKSVSLIPAAEEEQKDNGAGKLQSAASWNFVTARIQKLDTEAPRDGPKTHMATATNPVNMRNNKTQNGSLYHVTEPYKNSREDENVNVAADQALLQENHAWATYKREMQLLSQSRSNHIRDSQEKKEKTGQKRDYINMSELACSQFSSNHNKTDKICESGTLGTYKRVKLDEIQVVPCSVPFSTAAAQQILYSSIAKSSTETEVSTNRNNCQILLAENQFCGPRPVGNHCQENRSSSEEIFHRDRMMRKTLHQKTEIHIPDVLTRASNQNIDFTSQKVPSTINSHTDAAVRSQTVRVESSNQKIRSKKEQKNMETTNFHFYRNTKGKKKEKVTIDEIIRRLEVLDIRNSDQALVPYEGHGTLVPFEGFESLRRRKPRPKVNLDSQTIRQWNLLMGNVMDEDTTDPDKEKWWEAEREVFNGRVEKFIARMHLVQGDRRFSPWKGSVVDSVIGVFLTQNVSDHLSSSAFMSLAAQFPINLAVTKETCTSMSALIEEPELQIIDPDGTITFPRGAIRQALYKQDSTISSNHSEQLTENLLTHIGVHLSEDNNVATEDVISSQNSSDSIILQASEDVRNSSDSEVEGHTIFPKSNQIQNKKLESADRFPQNSFLLRSPMPAYQPLDNSVCLDQNPRLSITKHVGPSPINLNVLSSEKSFSPSTTLMLNFISDTRGTEPCLSIPLGKSSISSFPPSEADLTESQDVFSVRKSAGPMQANLLSSTTKETGTTNNHRFRIDGLSNANHDVNLLPESPFVNYQPSTKNHRDQSLKSFPWENSTAKETQRPDETQFKRQSGKLVPSGEHLGNTASNMSNGRRKKNDTSKMEDIDWDALRKQVLQESRNKERGVDKMDSMDYEALRHAEVDKISYAIRERGMNNMLAERIKAFLNRVVSDHGSVDLEWLRDVPSDKAKDYLLSIRGLGLKSVECVRLLSLHHMAFPVDTNVGRIAVRLGWVPIQPLPESLQLHLLEMYPILETVQKYLWPRLCKLDQRTLYELHYQMITFGKVFCTKSKPNCNVCPMKGDCRHFASAFASARLALPGPEERSMVSYTTPVAPVEELNISTDPLLLPSAESSLGIEPQYFSGKWEPIVEEPRTPESCTEVTESDIEDMLSEDPDEIPMIKFSLEALKANVHHIIQEQNMQISEGDLSRALVSLDPSTASIPAPKLKNVSRLRTEHQVYELPDSHPVLEGLDRREPDDPSPYLLAIWTPGESANSVQPFENKCNLSGSGRLCDDKRCFQCNTIRQRDSGIVRGTILIPCRTAMRGSFPLNGTYFQVNEVFADHESGMNPITVPRDSLWHLPRRTVYFGTSVTTIFKGMTIEGIQYCFWRGFVCVRGFDRKTRAPKPLLARLHFPASKLAKNKKEER